MSSRLSDMSGQGGATGPTTLVMVYLTPAELADARRAQHFRNHYRPCLQALIEALPPVIPALKPGDRVICRDGGPWLNLVGTVLCHNGPARWWVEFDRHPRAAYQQPALNLEKIR